MVSLDLENDSVKCPVSLPLPRSSYGVSLAVSSPNHAPSPSRVSSPIRALSPGISSSNRISSNKSGTSDSSPATSIIIPLGGRGDLNSFGIGLGAQTMQKPIEQTKPNVVQDIFTKSVTKETVKQFNDGVARITGGTGKELSEDQQIGFLNSMRTLALNITSEFFGSKLPNQSNATVSDYLKQKFNLNDDGLETFKTNLAAYLSVALFVHYKHIGAPTVDVIRDKLFEKLDGGDHNGFITALSSPGEFAKLIPDKSDSGPSNSWIKSVTEMFVTPQIFSDMVVAGNKRSREKLQLEAKDAVAKTTSPAVLAQADKTLLTGFTKIELTDENYLSVPDGSVSSAYLDKNGEKYILKVFNQEETADANISDSGAPGGAAAGIKEVVMFKLKAEADGKLVEDGGPILFQTIEGLKLDTTKSDAIVLDSPVKTFNLREDAKKNIVATTACLVNEKLNETSKIFVYTDDKIDASNPNGSTALIIPSENAAEGKALIIKNGELLVVTAKRNSGDAITLDEPSNKLLDLSSANYTASVKGNQITLKSENETLTVTLREDGKIGIVSSVVAIKAGEKEEETMTVAGLKAKGVNFHTGEGTEAVKASELTEAEFATLNSENKYAVITVEEDQYVVEKAKLAELRIDEVASAEVSWKTPDAAQESEQASQQLTAEQINTTLSEKGFNGLLTASGEANGPVTFAPSEEFTYLLNGAEVNGVANFSSPGPMAASSIQFSDDGNTLTITGIQREFETRAGHVSTSLTLDREIQIKKENDGSFTITSVESESGKFIKSINQAGSDVSLNYIENKSDAQTVLTAKPKTAEATGGPAQQTQLSMAEVGLFTQTASVVAEQEEPTLTRSFKSATAVETVQLPISDVTNNISDNAFKVIMADVTKSISDSVFNGILVVDNYTNSLNIKLADNYEITGLDVFGAPSYFILNADQFKIDGSTLTISQGESGFMKTDGTTGTYDDVITIIKKEDGSIEITEVNRDYEADFKLVKNRDASDASGLNVQYTDNPEEAKKTLIARPKPAESASQQLTAEQINTTLSEKGFNGLLTASGEANGPVTFAPSEEFTYLLNGAEVSGVANFSSPGPMAASSIQFSDDGNTLTITGIQREFETRASDVSTSLTLDREIQIKKENDGSFTITSVESESGKFIKSINQAGSDVSLTYTEDKSEAQTVLTAKPKTAESASQDATIVISNPAEFQETIVNSSLKNAQIAFDQEANTFTFKSIELNANEDGTKKTPLELSGGEDQTPEIKIMPPAADGSTTMEITWKNADGSTVNLHAGATDMQGNQIEQLPAIDKVTMSKDGKVSVDTYTINGGGDTVSVQYASN